MTSPPREHALVAAAVVLYAAVAVPIGIHKGGDFAAEVGQSEHLLQGTPMFTDADPEKGVPWPPFSAVALAPFTLLARWSMPVAKGAFALLSVACLAWSVLATRTGGGGGAWKPTILALAVLAVPIQTNFEDLNVNAVLLALLILATRELERGRALRAGVAVGVMTALKAFPGALFLYFAYRRQWRALAVGVAVAAALTLLSVAPYGPADGAATLRTWIAATTAGGFHHFGSNQSLEALVLRLGGSPMIALALALAGLALVAWRLGRTPGNIGREVAIAALVAVLLSPIAHTHYFVLAFPAWVWALREAGEERLRRAALAVAGFLTSGIYTVVSYDVRHQSFELAPYTWGALILVGVLCFRSSTP